MSEQSNHKRLRDALSGEHPERLVTQEELLKIVWQHNFVSDGLLRGYIRELRQVLGDDAKARASSRPRAGGVTGSSPRSLPPTRVPSGGAALPPAIAPQLRRFYFDEELLRWNEYGNPQPCEVMRSTGAKLSIHQTHADQVLR